ncbi:MAG: cell division protein FtsZ [Kiritimatiellae bacterium]|nr:cell division protein FtsZ [Kiritimatiellia bacterium]MDD5522640.1 cell division protein FtsZ [Kiritimatiellia bacterium]
MHERKVSIVGLGGGGCKVVDWIARTCHWGPAVTAISTDTEVLASSHATTKLQIGSTRTAGLGTGGDVNLGRLAAEDDIEMIRSLFESIDLVIFVVALGGGTGTGAAPVILSAARDSGALTLCFAILPFNFEGQQKKECAEQGVLALRDVSDALIVVPNERLFEFIGVSNVADSFEKADEVISDGISSVWKLIMRPGFISLDFAHLQTIVRNGGGICTFGYGIGSGTNRIESALKSLMEGSLLEKGDVISNARSLLVSIAGGNDLTLKEIDDIMKAISAKKQKDAKLFMGTVVDNEVHDRVSITVIASEKWSSDPVVVPVETKVGEISETGEKPKRSRSGSRAKDLQTKLKLEPTGKGRFKDVEPTVLDGEDFDIPTFVRRGIAVER